MSQKNTPVLTFEDIQTWREQRFALGSQREKLDSEIAVLDGKLRAAAMFVGNHILKGIEPEIDGDQAPASGPGWFRDAAIATFRANPEGLTPKQFLEAIKKQDMAVAERVAKTHPNYVYTLLAKLIKGGDVERDDNAIYRLKRNDPPSGFPQGGSETGSHSGSQPHGELFAKPRVVSGA